MALLWVQLPWSPLPPPIFPPAAVDSMVAGSTLPHMSPVQPMPAWLQAFVAELLQRSSTPSSPGSHAMPASHAAPAKPPATSIACADTWLVRVSRCSRRPERLCCTKFGRPMGQRHLESLKISYSGSQIEACGRMDLRFFLQVGKPEQARNGRTEFCALLRSFRLAFVLICAILRAFACFCVRPRLE